MLLFPVKVEEPPGHIVKGDAVPETTGFGLTVTETNADPVQPDAFPVTVYVALAIGQTETVCPIKPPGFQVYIVPVTTLLAVKEEHEPEHIDVGDAVAVIVKLGITVTVTDVLPVHP